MAATPIPVIEARTGYLYDGTNSPDLAAAIDDFTVVSETATLLTFTSGGNTLTVPKNGYVVAHNSEVAPADVFSNADDFYDIYAAHHHLDHVHEIKWVTTVALPAAESDE